MSKCTLAINLSNIRYNYNILQKICKNSEVGAAVKANCYGLGMHMIAPVLSSIGCKHFFVANKEEGVELREMMNMTRPGDKGDFRNIHILNGYFPEDEDDFIKYQLIPILNSMHQIKNWENFTNKYKNNNNKYPCYIHIDTGMNRLGVSSNEVSTININNQNNNQNNTINNNTININNNQNNTNNNEINTDTLNILCVMSHLSCAEDFHNVANIEQLNLFKKLSSFFPKSKKSLANSSGIFLGSEYHFDIARPGVGLYGGNPAPYLKNNILKNVVNLHAPIIQIKELLKGNYVGYNRSYIANDNKLIGILPIGYADGYLRSLSNKGIVYINNQPAPIIGRVSMDTITIDISNINKNDIFLGQSVEIIGDNMNIDNIARIADTNSYEILTMLGNRYTRVYHDSN
eukprot:GHVL01002208.1.p1 GENE.GHVL01002208.1~~GHVL01002208.1.p1  ORF type:complete len:403 (+),score=101.70 GHVL01002208.1:123-1331(+)